MPVNRLPVYCMNASWELVVVDDTSVISEEFKFD